MKYRFKPKPYGRGFVPVSIKGWLFTFVLLGVVLASAYINNLTNSQEPTIQDVLRFVVDLFVIIFSSLRFMDSKTKKKLKRRRGGK